ncbi:MAG: type II toxin-antitoxin system MqsA family antitoxin [Calditrichaeota bacterium]|nr:type II toxin-antitoxin system MqsA family antitoxin [Calditrichota bacterium]
MDKPETDACPLCGGKLKESTTIFTADIGSGVVVVRDVPALVCDLCGEDWIADEEADRLEEIANETRRKKNLVEVLPYSA